MFLKIVEQSILIEPNSIVNKVYTVEGSTLNLTFKDIVPLMHIRSNGNEYYVGDYVRFETKKYDSILRPNIIEFQMTNVTANDTGFYWIDYLDLVSTLQLSIISMYVVTCYMILPGSYCFSRYSYMVNSTYLTNK